MNVMRIIAVGLVLAGSGLVVICCSAMDKAKCDSASGVTCTMHGHQSCRALEDEQEYCGGDCYYCYGSQNLSAEMCFYDELEDCTPTTPVPCGNKRDGDCTDYEETGPCGCDPHGTYTGTCTFSACTSP